MPSGQYDRSKARPRKTPRGPLSDAEKDRIVELYVAGEHSMRDLAEEFNSNPASINRALTEREVPKRKPGSSDISVRNLKRNNAKRREEAELRMAEEIRQARLRDRVDAKADEIAAQTEEHAEERLEATFRPRASTHAVAHAEAAQAMEIIDSVDNVLKDVGFFSAQLRHGHLVWQPTVDLPLPEGVTWADVPAGAIPTSELPASEPEPSAEEMAAEHSKELERAHAWSKEQWAAGVRHGYEQATSSVVDLLKEFIQAKSEGSIVHNALTKFLGMLEDGEHWYRQHKERKPWLNPENWR